MKRLVLMVEGDGDREAAPVLVKRILTEQDAWAHLILDPRPFVIGGFPQLARDDFSTWRRFLRAAAKRKNFGGCLTILDGDCKGKFDGQAFCAMSAARRLSVQARETGAGAIFSLAIAIACQEYESWLIAGVESLAGRNLPDGRRGVPRGITAPASDLEDAPRDAKGWLNQRMATGYNPVRDQADLT